MCCVGVFFAARQDKTHGCLLCPQHCTKFGEMQLEHLRYTETMKAKEAADAQRHEELKALFTTTAEKHSCELAEAKETIARVEAQLTAREEYRIAQSRLRDLVAATVREAKTRMRSDSVIRVLIRLRYVASEKIGLPGLDKVLCEHSPSRRDRSEDATVLQHAIDTLTELKANTTADIVDIMDRFKKDANNDHHIRSKPTREEFLADVARVNGLERQVLSLADAEAIWKAAAYFQQAIPEEGMDFVASGSRKRYYRGG